MIAYAAHQRKLAQVQKDGSTMRAHLEAAARHSPTARRELEGPALPMRCAYVWTWFTELNAARSAGPMGPNPISYSEIDAWARLGGRKLAGFELAWLRRLDHVWLTDPKAAAAHGPADRD